MSEHFEMWLRPRTPRLRRAFCLFALRARDGLRSPIYRSCAAHVLTDSDIPL